MRACTFPAFMPHPVNQCQGHMKSHMSPVTFIAKHVLRQADDLGVESLVEAYCATLANHPTGFLSSSASDFLPICAHVGMQSLH